MGVELNTAKALLWAKNLGVSFARTLTLGHQSLYCSPARLRRAFQGFGIPATPEQIDRCFQHETFTALYADEFFRLLGAEEMTSVDRSDFEQATLLHDLNEPFPERFRGHFDLVVDGGTLEHIFNYPAALRHCLEVVRVGGHFMTVTPASNQMGHGFYQFSPELFFRVFSAENGFALRKIVLFDASGDEPPFYEVKDPAVTRQRTELRSARPLQLIVLAQKIADVPIFASLPQQSDYAAVWASSRERNATDNSGASSGWWRKLRMKVNPYWPWWLRRWRDIWRERWRNGPPDLNNRRHFRKLSWAEIFRERNVPPGSSATEHHSASLNSGSPSS
jgi:SAM-dependent methyltransferase